MDSQDYMKLLEAWGGMERQHLQAITAIKVNMQSTSIALRHASDLTASIKLILTTCSSSEAEKIVAMLSELAKVIAQEKQLLEEFYDLFQTIGVFEVQERSVKCNLVQLEGWQQKYQLQQFLLPEITS
ncbi:QWRF motif-containing protein 3 [Glycine max]|nr:QWRF motif-containing protein 3 [Glycine max]